MTTWKKQKLSQLIEMVIDYRGKTPKKLGSDWSGKGIKALSAKNIKRGRIVNPETIRFVDEKLYHKWMKEEVKRGDILMTSEAPLGETYYVNNDEKILLSQRLFAIRADKSKLDSLFLYYYLQSQQGQNELQSRITGSTVGGIRQSELLKIEIFYPEQTEAQQKTASTLSTYDDLIEANEKRIKILEEMAQRFYTEWFVKFRFPGHEKVKLVDSHTTFGMIPEGWAVRKFYEVVTNHDSKRKPISSMERESMKGVYPYYGAAKVIDHINKYLFDGRFLLVAEDGTVITKTGNPMLQFVDEKFWVSNHAHIVQGKLLSTEQIYIRLSKFDITPLITGSAQPKITKENLSRIEFIVPDQSTKMLFDSISRNIFDQLFNLRKQVEYLAKTRDLLIPQLISGKREVK